MNNKDDVIFNNILQRFLNSHKSLQSSFFQLVKNMKLCHFKQLKKYFNKNVLKHLNKLKKTNLF